MLWKWKLIRKGNSRTLKSIVGASSEDGNLSKNFPYGMRDGDAPRGAPDTSNPTSASVLLGMRLKHLVPKGPRLPEIALQTQFCHRIFLLQWVGSPLDSIWENGIPNTLWLEKLHKEIQNLSLQLRVYQAWVISLWNILWCNNYRPRLQKIKFRDLVMHGLMHNIWHLLRPRL